MERFWYYSAILLQKFLRALPLSAVARLGRFGGGVAYYIDVRHRNVALLNLEKCFPQKSASERRAIVKEHFRRLGENFSSAVKTSGMGREELAPHLEVTGTDKLRHGGKGAILAIGHFGNFEIYAHATEIGGGLPMATTYRGLKQPRLDALVRSMRVESGTLFFDRHEHAGEMRRALSRGGIVFGLLCDHHAGSRGVPGTFFGHECSVMQAPALFAQRYDLPLHAAVCFRVGPGRWRVEIGDEIPTRGNGARRAPADIMADVNREFEAAILRDLPNWFWCHDRWRFRKGLRWGKAPKRKVLTAT